ncbi:hypothetical protein [Streptomyces fradiae]
MSKMTLLSICFEDDRNPVVSVDVTSTPFDFKLVVLMAAQVLIGL